MSGALILRIICLFRGHIPVEIRRTAYVTRYVELVEDDRFCCRCHRDIH